MGHNNSRIQFQFLSAYTPKIARFGREKEPSSIRELELYGDVTLPGHAVQCGLHWHRQSKAVHKPAQGEVEDSDFERKKNKVVLGGIGTL